VSTLITPTPGRILVLCDKGEEITDGGIVIPEAVQEKKVNKGTVVAVPRVPDLPMEVKTTMVLDTLEPDQVNQIVHAFKTDFNVDDRVLFDKYAGHDLEVDGAHYVILKDEEVVALLEEVDDATS